jgi:hypothetical protein
MQTTDIGKYFFPSRTMELWNYPPADALGTLSYEPNNFRERVRKLMNQVKCRCGGNHQKVN